MLYRDTHAENVLTYKIKCLLMNILLLYAPPLPSLTTNHSLKEILPFSIMVCVRMSVKDILICHDQNIYTWHRPIVLGGCEIFLLTQKNVQRFYVLLIMRLDIIV